MEGHVGISIFNSGFSKVVMVLIVFLWDFLGFVCLNLDLLCLLLHLWKYNHNIRAYYVMEHFRAHKAQI